MDEFTELTIDHGISPTKKESFGILVIAMMVHDAYQKRDGWQRIRL
jgi:hypothetical protein